MIKIGLSGCNGTMGKILDELLGENDETKVVFGITNHCDEKQENYPVFQNTSQITVDCDVIIDFSNQELTDALVSYCITTKTPLVIATTGLSHTQEEHIEQAAKFIPIFKSSNTSLGVNVLIDLVKRATNLLSEQFDIEIIEKHHNQKVDAPSGTALMIATAINEQLQTPRETRYGRQGTTTKREVNEIGIHAIRGGTIPGEHSVIFAGLDEIIEIKHTALSKKVFAKQAISIAKRLINKQPKLYTMNEFMEQTDE